MSAAKDFLIEHPNEVIFARVTQPNDVADKTFDREWDLWNEYLWEYTNDKNPQLGDVRGKIVFFNGPHETAGNNRPLAARGKIFGFATGDDNQFIREDDWNMRNESKRIINVKSSLDEARTNLDNKIHFTGINGVTIGWNPKDWANFMNPVVRSYMRVYQGLGQVGVLWIDYPTDTDDKPAPNNTIVQAIINMNF
jgi:hypothetical protein